MLLDVVDQAAGGGDDHVGAGLQDLALLVVVHAAVHQGELEAEVGAELHRVLVDLDRQFAGRGEDQGARVLGLAVGERGAREQAVEDRDQERERLAGAGLCLARDVAAGERKRQRQRLDGGASVESGGFESREELGMEVEFGEGDIGKGLVAHACGDCLWRGRRPCAGGRPRSRLPADPWVRGGA